MKKLFLIPVFVALVMIGYLLVVKVAIPTQSRVHIDTTRTDSEQSTLTTIAENLFIPWSVVPLSANTYLVSERNGTISRIQQGEKTTITELDVYADRGGEGGLLGIAVSPIDAPTMFLYVYYTYRDPDEKVWNRVVRYTFNTETDALTEQKGIIDYIPGAKYHNGGRLGIGPDQHLYITTGDALDKKSAQDITSLAGKILRVDTDGGIPSDNPIENSPVYSYGHRNPQGLAWDETNTLWSTEHGHTSLDGINRIVSGGNYGWPDSAGDETAEGTIAPALHSGTDTWAPAGLTYYKEKLYFAGLRGQAMYEVTIKNGRITALNEIFKNTFGRVRVVVTNPFTTTLLFATSNRDGRGRERQNDDKLFEIEL